MGKELVSYVRSALEKGYSEDAIRKRLIQNGWSEKKVKRAIRKAKGGSHGIVLATMALLFVVVIGGGIFLLIPSSEEAAPQYDPEELADSSGADESEDEYPCSEYSTARLEQLECFKNAIDDADGTGISVCERVPLEEDRSLRTCRTALSRSLNSQNSDSPV